MKLEKIFLAIIVLVMIFSIAGVSATNLDNNDSMTDHLFNNQLLTNDKTDVQLITEDFSMYYKNGSRLEATLLDMDDNPLTNKTIELTINGVTYTRVTDENGRAGLNINLNPGIYDSHVFFNGDSYYNNASADVTVTVLNGIHTSDLIKIYKNDSQFIAEIVDGKGNPISNVDVCIAINGVGYYRTTNASGMAKLNINLGPGTYTVLTTNLLNGFSNNNQITVLSTISSSDFSKGYKDSRPYTVSLVDSKGNPLSNAEVGITINGVTYYKTTDDNGMAKLNINLGPGQYIIKSTDISNGLTCSNTVTVLSYLNTYLEFDADEIIESYGGNIYVTLYDSLGNTIPNEKVTLSIDKQSYTLTTDSNGRVSHFINITTPGNYTCKAIYDGSKYYQSSNLNFIVTVIKRLGVNFTVLTEDTLFNGEYFKVLVQDEYGNILKDVPVIFSINQQTIQDLTDGNGIAMFKIDLPSNYYLLEYYVDSKYYSFEKSNQFLKVYDSSETYLIPKSSDIVKGTTFDVSLYSGDMPLTNRTVIITVNGRDYYKVTNELGIASLNINLNPGQYIISYKFEGDSKFDSSSGSTSIEVYENITNTILKPESTYEFVYGKENYFIVKLTDINGKALPNQIIRFYFNDGVTDVLTDEGGLAGIEINNVPGVYTVLYEFEGTYAYNGSSEYTFITIKEQGAVLNAGYYLNAKDMYNVDLEKLSKQGTNVIILNEYALSKYGHNAVSSWINEAHSYGIQIFMSFNTYYDGNWINPTSNGKIRYDLIDELANEAVKYVNYGVDGIILDYLRFPGTAYKYQNGAEAITECALLINAAVKDANPNVFVGAFVMPETTQDKYYYGQDINELSKVLDYIIPMVYKGNYNSGTSWITSTSKWFQTNSQGAEVWIIIQSYISDNNVKPLSYSELVKDSQAALDGGVDGVLVFRYGSDTLIKPIDFTELDYHGEGKIDPVSGVYVSIKDILNAASSLKVSIESNGVLPEYVIVGKYNVTMPQFLYLLTKATVAINNNNLKDIELINVSKPLADSGDHIHADLSKNGEGGFIDAAERTSAYIEENGYAPSYSKTAVGNVKYSSLIYAYSKILNYYNNNDALPYTNYITNLLDEYSITVTMKPSSSRTEGYQYIDYVTTWLNYCPSCGFYGTLLVNPKGVYEGEFTCDKCDADFCGVTGMDKYPRNIYLTRLSASVPVGNESTAESLSLSDILDAANKVKNYYETNHELPDHVTIGGANYNCPTALYLFSQAIVNINNKNFNDIEVFIMNTPGNPQGDRINAQLMKADYLDMFKRNAKWMLEYEQAPNYSSSVLGKIKYEELVDASSRILTYYKNNNELPNYVQIVINGGSSKSIKNLTAQLTSGLTSERDKALVLYNYVRDNIAYEFYYNTQKGAEGTLTAGGGNCCDQAQLLIAMCREAGLTCRFVHGTCRFSDGTFGHVWAQIYLEGNWVVADPTSTRNSLGVINNWNTNTYTLHGYYDVLPF